MLGWQFQLHLNRARTGMRGWATAVVAQTCEDYRGRADRAVTLSLPPEHHLGYLCVREYFPDHQPRLNLIADPGHGYGAGTCSKCGQRVQYEARHDALCVVTSGARWRYDPDCPRGGQHEIV